MILQPQWLRQKINQEFEPTNALTELECKLESCIDSISNWYGMNKLCIDKKKSSVMVIGSKFQLRSLNLGDFAISINVDELQLVEAQVFGFMDAKWLKLRRPYSRIVQENVLLCSHVSSSQNNLPIPITA